MSDSTLVTPPPDTDRDAAAPAPVPGAAAAVAKLEATVASMRQAAGAPESEPFTDAPPRSQASAEPAAGPQGDAGSEPIDLEPVKRALMELNVPPPAPFVPLAVPVGEAVHTPLPVPVAPRRLQVIADRSASPAATVAGNIGVLLINLGTPDAAETKAVRRYLKEFLTDPRVIEKNSLVWRLVLNGIILPLRPRIKARAYRKIWNNELNESPLKTITRGQAEKLAATLAGVSETIVVDWAMRYGNPSIPERLQAMEIAGCERILLMPLYPQYSAATTATACDAAFRVLMQMRQQPSFRVLPPYYADGIYIDALATTIERHLAALETGPDVILASYHGVPQEYVDRGDPYERHCIETTRLLRERLGLDESKLMMSFQSRFGRAKWLQPYTAKVVKQLAKSGVKHLAVVTPGFSADCIETLEEIALENAHIFKKAGGETFTTIPCLNDSEPGMTMLSQLALRELQGWV